MEGASLDSGDNWIQKFDRFSILKSGNIFWNVVSIRKYFVHFISYVTKIDVSEAQTNKLNIISLMSGWWLFNNLR